MNKHALIVLSPQELKEYNEIDKSPEQIKLRLTNLGIGTLIEVKNRKGKWIDISDTGTGNQGGKIRKQLWQFQKTV